MPGEWGRSLAPEILDGGGRSRSLRSAGARGSIFFRGGPVTEGPMFSRVSSVAIRRGRRHNFLTVQIPTGFHFLCNAFRLFPIELRRGATRRWLQIPPKNVHAGRGYLLPKGNKFKTNVRGPAQGILHTAHGNERAAKGTGHASNYAPTIKGGLLRRIQIHPRVMFRPFPGAKFRSDLARHLPRMSENRAVQSLLKQGDKFAQDRLMQMQRKLTERRMQLVRDSNSRQPRHGPGELPPVPAASYRAPTFPPILLLPTKEREREAYCRTRGNWEGVTIHVFNK